MTHVSVLQDLIKHGAKWEDSPYKSWYFLKPGGLSRAEYLPGLVSLYCTVVLYILGTSSSRVG